MTDDPNGPINDLPPEDIVACTVPQDRTAVVEEFRSRLGQRLTVHFPGTPIEDVDGTIVGMTEPTIYTDLFGSLRTGDDNAR